MRKMKDNKFDLAIVDVPYGIKASSDSRFGKFFIVHLNGMNKKVPSKNYKKSKWDNKPPKKEYFDELIRVSKNQIIWGANHFIDKIPYKSSCWIVWDKENGESYGSDCELAYTNFSTAVRMFKWKWNGMLQHNMALKEERIHPTQKPVALYKWLLKNYAKEGDTILDTHVGSGSHRIACWEWAFHLKGMRLTKIIGNHRKRDLT